MEEDHRFPFPVLRFAGSLYCNIYSLQTWRGHDWEHYLYNLNIPSWLGVYSWVLKSLWLWLRAAGTMMEHILFVLSAIMYTSLHSHKYMYRPYSWLWVQILVYLPMTHSSLSCNNMSTSKSIRPYSWIWVQENVLKLEYDDILESVTRMSTRSYSWIWV